MQGDAIHAHRQKIIHAPDDQAMLDRFAGPLNGGGRETPPRIVADPKSVERDLARLVLSVVELLRKLLAGEIKSRSRRNVVQARSFAYPDGAWTPAVAEHAARAGYTVALTLEAADATPTSAPLALPRRLAADSFDWVGRTPVPTLAPRLRPRGASARK